MTTKKNTRCPHYVALMCRVTTPEGVKVICECGWVFPDPTFELILSLPGAKLKKGFIFKDGKVRKG